MVADKIVAVKMVAILEKDYISSAFDTYLVSKSHKQVIHTLWKSTGVKVEAGFDEQNHIVSESGIGRLIDDFIDTVLSVPLCPYHFVLEPKTLSKVSARVG